MSEESTQTGLWTTIRGAIRGKGIIPINLKACVKADDAVPLAVFADGVSDVPGVQITNSETWGVRWNNHAAPLGIAINVPARQDLDIIYPVDFYALVSKTGATAADVTSLTLAMFIIGAGSLHDADADCGGVTNQVTGDATAKTVSLLRRRIAVADLVAPPCTFQMSITPTAGLLGTDDLVLHSAWLEYTRKYVAAYS